MIHEHKKVLIIGSGGREHALAWRFKKDENNSTIYYTGTNAGMDLDGMLQAKNIDGHALKVTRTDGFKSVKKFIENNEINYVIVGPEQPLADGLVDVLENLENTYIFGPSMIPAMLESDKFYSYDLNQDLGIPQAYGVPAHDGKRAKIILENWNYSEGVVLKTRGLAAGKGVIVCDSPKEALDKLDDFLELYGERILISERLPSGEEFSAFAFSDGEIITPLGIIIKDHKRLNDHDQGPNTGGMGAYGPAINDEEINIFMEEKIFRPVVKEMAERRHPFKGVLYAGMMKTAEGLKVLEYNVRFGDPECQPAMMLLHNISKPIIGSATSNQDLYPLKTFNGAACCVVMASKGYPNKYETGKEIIGLKDSSLNSVVEKGGNKHWLKIFHAGTILSNSKIYTNGGRVLGVTAYSPEGIKAAAEIAYDAVRFIDKKNPDMFHFRKDIGVKE